MKLQDAYSKLNIPTTATPDEAKKAFRNLSKKYHPDVCKEKDAEIKFKEINEAYQCIKNGKGSDPEPMQRSPFDPFGINVNPFGRQEIHYEATNIDLFIEISFKEAVLGIKKEISYQRTAKCEHCDGKGEILQNNGCETCGGKGQVVSRNGNSVFIKTCQKCYGKTNSSECKTCNSEGILNTKVSVNVSIPGGVSDGNILRLGGMGNYYGSFMGMEQITDVLLHIKVKEQSGLSLKDQDVICNLNISLLEALQGCEKTVDTIFGNKQIEINPKSKHSDEILIPKCGVNQQGNQKVILNVSYPEDINEIIHILEKSK